MAASTAVRQTALSLDAAFMEDAVPVAATRRQTGRNLAALMIVSAIGSLALVSALAPSAGASSLRGDIQLRRLDDAADDASGLCCILNGVDGIDFKYTDPRAPVRKFHRVNFHAIDATPRRTRLVRHVRSYQRRPHPR